MHINNTLFSDNIIEKEKMQGLMEKTVVAGPAEKGEEEERLLETRVVTDGVTVVDFDVLCSTVAMQTQKGKWGILNGNVDLDHEDENEGAPAYGGGGGGGGGGRGVLRMWEGELLYDCFDDRRIAIQSACCPCYRFGKNMRRAGFGPCFLQGSVYLILAIIALLNMLAFIVTKRRSFLYLAIVFTFSVGAYMGFLRTQIRRKFNIRDNDTPLDDFVDHLLCPCCTLCQESRTLEMNNVQDGIWHGRGDTICIGSYSEAGKAFFQLSPPPIVSTNYPEPCSIQKPVNDNKPS